MAFDFNNIDINKNFGDLQLKSLYELMDDTMFNNTLLSLYINLNITPFTIDCPNKWINVFASPTMHRPYLEPNKEGLFYIIDDISKYNDIENFIVENCFNIKDFYDEPGYAVYQWFREYRHYNKKQLANTWVRLTVDKHILVIHKKIKANQITGYNFFYFKLS